MGRRWGWANRYKEGKVGTTAWWIIYQIIEGGSGGVAQPWVERSIDYESRSNSFSISLRNCPKSSSVFFLALWLGSLQALGECKKPHLRSKKGATGSTRLHFHVTNQKARHGIDSPDYVSSTDASALAESIKAHWLKRLSRALHWAQRTLRKLVRWGFHEGNTFNSSILEERVKETWSVFQHCVTAITKSKKRDNNIKIERFYYFVFL